MKQQHPKQNTPNFTQVPNWILDEANRFTMPEFMILMIIARKTYGWHKDVDAISLSQLESQSGLNRNTIKNAIKGLIQKEVIVRLTGKIAYRYAIVGGSLDNPQGGQQITPEAPKGGQQITPQKKEYKESEIKPAASTEIIEIDNIPLDDRFEARAFELFTNYGSTISRTTQYYKELEELRKITSSDLDILNTKLRYFRRHQKENEFFGKLKLNLKSMLRWWNEIPDYEPEPIRENETFNGLEAI